MTRREYLERQYEDALFALLMDDVADEEGRALLEENERLKADPSAAVSEEFNERCLQTIRRHFAKQKMRQAGRFTVKTLGRVAVAAGIAALLFIGAFAASETVRANTMNLIVEVFEEKTNFYFGNGQPTTDLPIVTVGWLPEGFTLEEQDSDNTSIWSIYSKSENEFFIIGYELSNGTLLSIDTEDAKVDEINFNGTQATMVVKEDEVQIIWTTTDQTAFIQIVAFGITEKDLIHIAQEINY